MEPPGDQPGGEMKRPMTIDGGAELDERLWQTCQQAARGIQSIVPGDRLQGLLLGGGYGRGEGGVLNTPQGPQPYNDLEFYVFIRGFTPLNDRRYHGAITSLGLELSPNAGLDVEFKILSLEQLRNSPVTMFYYDLVKGHQWVIGDDELLKGCEHLEDASQIPLHEATRLLMNRCSGLLFADERLQRAGFGASDSDFTGRNLAKAQLALGDVLLAMSGKYHWSCRERNQRLAGMQFHLDARLLETIRQHHKTGVEFKLHPRRSEASREELKTLHASIKQTAMDLWLVLENRRLNQNFATIDQYALSGINKCPETPAWRNRLVNLKSFGFTRALSSSRYPRERLFNALCLLLWKNNAETLPFIQSQLATPATTFSGLVKAYEQLWSRFN